MEELQHVTFVLLAIGALVSLAGLAAGLYEYRTGGLVRIPFRRKVPATADDVRKNGLALALNDLGVLLTDAIVLSVLLLYHARFGPFEAIGYFAVGAAGFTAVFLTSFTALRMRTDIRYEERTRPDSAPSTQI